VSKDRYTKSVFVSQAVRTWELLALSTIGHAEETLAGVLELEVLIRELGAINALSASSVTYSSITSSVCGSRVAHAVVDLPFVKSSLLSVLRISSECVIIYLPPPWIMKLLITRWKVEPSYPKPFSPVARALSYLLDPEATRRIIRSRTGSSRRSWGRSCRKDRW
jgi:hypothetical protein